MGHAFSEETLLAAQSDALEGALWSAVRALEEKGELARRLADRARGRGMPRSAAGFDQSAQDAERGSSMIRETLLQGPGTPRAGGPGRAGRRRHGTAPDRPGDRPASGVTPALPALPAPDSRVIAGRVIAISTSAGGLAALRVLLGDLPASLAAAVLVVQHLLPYCDSHLVEILRWHSSLEISESRPALRLWCGTVYVAPPDFHLLVGIDRRLVLSNLPPLNFCRPSSDRMFASLAEVYGRDTVAVVLTGRGRDGAVGAQLVRRMGGHVIVQDPETADMPTCPEPRSARGRWMRCCPSARSPAPCDPWSLVAALVALPLVAPPLISPRVLA